MQRIFLVLFKNYIITEPNFLKSKNGLLPVIVKDTNTKTVLILIYF